MNNIPQLLYEFGPFRLDMPKCRLLRRGNPVTLRPKLYDLLTVLVERRGQMVSKDELIESLWGAKPERADSVDAYESNLSVSIGGLRKALGNDQYIETITGRGYRFAAEIKVLPVEPGADIPPTSTRRRTDPPGGAVPLDSPLYIARRTDEDDR